MAQTTNLVLFSYLLWLWQLCIIFTTYTFNFIFSRRWNSKILMMPRLNYLSSRFCFSEQANQAKGDSIFFLSFCVDVTNLIYFAMYHSFYYLLKFHVNLLSTLVLFIFDNFVAPLWNSWRWSTLKGRKVCQCHVNCIIFTFFFFSGREWNASNRQSSPKCYWLREGTQIFYIWSQPYTNRHLYWQLAFSDMVISLNKKVFVRP